MRSISFAVILLFAPMAVAEERAVQLLLPSQRLQPTSTFEVRFAAEMVRPEQLGKPAADSPLVFEPKLEGQFVWLSTRSGSFAPSATLPLGVKFKISLRQGLKDASGNPIAADLNETAETPPMRLKGSSVIGFNDSDNATATPHCLLLFNTDVEALAAAKFIWWEDAGGKRVDAKVEQADGVTDKTRRFYAWSSDDRSLATWSELASGKGAPEEPEPEGDEATPSTAKKVEPRRNVLFVGTTKPLPPGVDWRLVLAEGLPSAEWKIGLPERKEVKLGAVQPFVLESLDAETNRIAGRRLILRFSKSLAPKITPETLTQWVEITPAVKNLHPEIEDRTVTVKGDFALDTSYQVNVKAGLPASEPFALAQAVSRTVTFEKIAPRLYFEDFATHQYAEGTRRFRLLSINVPRLRVTAHLFAGGRIPAAVTAYDHYQDQPQGAPPDESYSRVEVEKLGGKMIWERELSPGGEADSHETLPLDWDEILGPHRTGAILLTAESIDPVNAAGKRVGTQAFVQLTDLGAVWKRGPTGALFLHVFSLATGRNLPGVKLRLLDKSEKQLAQAVTDALGNARLPKQDGEAEARWVQATRNDDSHLIAIFSAESDVPLYRLGLPDASVGSEGGEEQETEEVFLFSERGVYKPGDTLHLKGLARVPNDKGARVAAGKRLAITGTDARDREFFRKEITLSEFGSFTEDIPLPEGTLGKYHISAESLVEGEAFSGKYTFQVQEYRPNAFEISIPPPPAVSGPAELEFPVLAKYFMGAPLSRAKVTWSLVARDQGFKPEGLEAYAFCEAIEDFRLQSALDHTSQFNAQGNADLDPNGAATVRTQFPLNPKAPQPRAAKLLCEITDLNQQTVSQSVDFVRQSSDYYFGLHRFDAVVKEGEPLPIELIAVRPDGKPLAEPAKATLQITRIEWQTNRLDGAGDTAEFESKPILQVQWEKEVTLTPGQGPDRKAIPVTPEQIAAGKPGEYLLTAIGRDAAGHEIRTAMNFEVAGPGSATWDYRNSYAIDVASDKESYEPGQTATLLVKTPIAGEALVTVEHAHVVRSFIVQLTGNAPSIKVPIEEGDAPNVFVSVMVLRGAKESPRKIKAPEYRIGYCQLKGIAPPGEIERAGPNVRTGGEAG